MTRSFAGRLPWSTGQAVSAPDRDDPAPRWIELFACPAGHEFELPFAHDVELPSTWECRHHGLKSERLAAPPAESKNVKPPRTHRDMLLERRTIPELQALLDERLLELRELRIQWLSSMSSPGRETAADAATQR